MILAKKSNRKETKIELVSFMTKFEKSLILLSLLFLLGLGLVSHLAAQPLPLQRQPVERHAGESQRLDLNEATAEELCALPGVGPVTAERIIALREELGSFTSPEDLLAVEGIGEATLEKIYAYLEGD